MATFQVGHWTDSLARTGCTVILFDQLVPAIIDIRGGAPATHETDLLQPDKLVGQVDAILLTGGSAFGLAASDGVMRFLAERGRGWPTSVIPVPIVTAASLFDLGVGEARWPDSNAGYSACLDARPVIAVSTGAVGAGTGATIRKMWPTIQLQRGGFGIGTERVTNGTAVHALVAVNAVGDVVGTDSFGNKLSATNTDQTITEREATTLGVIIVDGLCDTTTLRRIAVSTHDAYARAIHPCHTLFDGDLVYVAQTGSTVDVDRSITVELCQAAELAMDTAIRSAVA